MEYKRIKVVWLCHFSNSTVFAKLDTGYSFLLRLLRKMVHKPICHDVMEYAVWVTNGIKEFEQIEEVELHVVSPYPHLKNRLQEFVLNGINYHFFQSEDDNALSLLFRRVFNPRYWHYKRNRKIVADIIRNVKPSVVHLIGAENPDYSLSLLDVPKDVITIAQLQTLLNDPDFPANYSLASNVYQYRAKVERAIIENAQYIGTTVVKFRKIISQTIRPNAIFLNTTLPLDEPIVEDETRKEYDFVYFATNLNKAADLAIEAFGIVYQKYNNVKFDVIGGCTATFMNYLEEIIHKYGIENAVRFEGRLATHNDVLKQIRKSRFALLPLKIDITSGTIREAMSNGLPVITTDTGEFGTRKLNSASQCVLISQIGDSRSLADNMIRLLEDADLATLLRNNAYESRRHSSSNEEIARHYLDAYIACLDHKMKGIPISDTLTVL